MPGELKHKSSESVTDADVQRLLNIALAGAGVIEGLTPRTQSGTTTLYGEYRIHHDKPFQKYAELSMVSPHVFIPLAKLGLSMVSSFRLEAEEGNEPLKEQMDEWAESIELKNKYQNIARCLVRDGTTAVYLPVERKSIIELEILPMKYVTLLPEGVSPGTSGNTLLKGEIEKIVLNESRSSEHSIKHTIFERDETALFRIFHEGYFMKDNMGRETYGLYGVSMLEPVERPIKNLLDLNEGYASYMRRYGVGRLHINVPLIDQLRAEGRFGEAKDLLEEIIASQRKLSPNQDIIGGGMEVSTLSTRGAPSVREMKESFQSDLHIGLLQSPIAMGYTKGSTYASGYLSEEDRYFILESIQSILKEIMQVEIIDRQLELMGHEAGEIHVVVDRLDEPYVDHRTLVDARMNGDIGQGELRERLGFPRDMPEDEAV